MQENKMGTTPIFKLLLQMALPMAISMLIQSLYNVVDSIYVGIYSDASLTAVGLAWPLQNLMIAFAVGIGVGVNAILSRSLGQHDNIKASKTAVNGSLIMVCIYLLFLVIGLTLIPTYMKSISNDNIVIDEGITYLKYVMIGSFGLMFSIFFERLLQSTGRTILVMITQASGAIINIALDPLFINGWWIIPKLGIAGAAIATLIAQYCTAIIGLVLNFKLNKDLHYNKNTLKIEGRLIKEILAIGIPSAFMSAISSVLTFAFNKILLRFEDIIIPGTTIKYGNTPQTVFGLYFKLNSIFFMPVFGINNAMVPIVAYQLGANKRKRMMDTFKYSILLTFIMMTIGTALFEFIPGSLLKIFSSSEQYASLYSLVGSPCLRIIASSFLIAAFCIVILSMFQALGNGVYSLICSIIRQLVVLLPVAYLLSLTNNLNVVWLSFLVAEIVAFIVSIVLFKKIYNDKIKLLDD